MTPEEGGFFAAQDNHPVPKYDVPALELKEGCTAAFKERLKGSGMTCVDVGKPIGSSSDVP